MGLEKFRIRDDVKWAHPELEQAYALMGNSVGYAEVLLNDENDRNLQHMRKMDLKITCQIMIGAV